MIGPRGTNIRSISMPITATLITGIDINPNILSTVIGVVWMIHIYFLVIALVSLNSTYFIKYLIYKKYSSVLILSSGGLVSAEVIYHFKSFTIS